MEDKEIQVYTGMIINNEKEEIPFGNFIIDKPENEEVKAKTSFTGYDYMIKFNIPYKDGVTYPCKAKVLFQDVCNQVGLVAGNIDFVNCDYMILGNPFTNNEDCRTVLSNIAQLAGGFAKIGRDNKVYIKTLKNISDLLTVKEVNLMTIRELNLVPVNMLLGNKARTDDSLDGNNYFDDFSKNKMWGEINSLVIGLSSIEGENTALDDKISIQNNGLTEITINDNYFLIDQAEREKIIEPLWNSLKGLKYLPFKAKYYGYPYFDSGDLIYVEDTQDNGYISYVFNHTFTFNGAFDGNIETPAMTKTQTQYKNTPDIKTKFRNVELKVDKINGEIVSVIEKVDENFEKMSQVLQTVDGITQKVENVTDLTNTVNGIKTITIEDAVGGAPIEIRICGNNTIFSELYFDDSWYFNNNRYFVESNSFLSINDKMYNLEVDGVLRQYKGVYDEYIYNYTENTAKVIRRVGVDGAGQLYVLPNEVAEDLPVPNLELQTGTNVITLPFDTANMSVKYVIKNDYTNMFATKVEMGSKIEQSASEIKTEVRESITTAKGELEKSISSISQTANEIRAEVNQNATNISTLTQTANSISSQVREKVGNDEIIAKLNVAVRDKKGIIELLGNIVKITSDNFSLDENGVIRATAGVINGFSLITENGLPILKGNNLGLAANSQTAIWVDNEGKRTFEVQLTGEVKVSALTLLSGYGFDHQGNVKCLSILVDGAPLIKTNAGDNGTEVQRIYRNENTYTFTFAVKNSGTWSIQMNPPSDKKLKDNIKDTDVVGLDVVNQIQFRQFDWNENYKKLGFNNYEVHEDFGIVADELEKVNPKFVLNTVQSDGSNLKTVNREELIYYNSKSIQELSKELNDVKKENKNLKMLVQELTSRIEKMEGVMKENG